MNLIFIGPQASGKGTQAKLLVEKFGFQYFETGKILRRLIAEGGELGQEIDKLINQQGHLVPDALMRRIITEGLSSTDLTQGVIFDGYPRNLDQYQTLKKIFAKFSLKINFVLWLKIRRGETWRRLTSRRICPVCQREYNLVTRPPQKDEICDTCLKKLIIRADDQPAVIEKRLAVYESQTAPIIEAARKEEILLELDGERSVEAIHQEIINRLGLLKSDSAKSETETE